MTETEQPPKTPTSKKIKTEEPASAVQKEPEVNVAHITLVNIQNILMDPAQIGERQLNPYTCQQVLKMIKDMMQHGGNEITGLRSIDGMVMYPCPKHDYAPITGCINDCDSFDGHDNLGICTNKETKIHGFDKYEYMRAVKKEEDLRRDAQIIDQPEEETEEEALIADDW